MIILMNLFVGPMRGIVTVYRIPGTSGVFQHMFARFFFDTRIRPAGNTQFDIEHPSVQSTVAESLNQIRKDTIYK